MPPCTEQAPWIHGLLEDKFRVKELKCPGLISSPKNILGYNGYAKPVCSYSSKGETSQYLYPWFYISIFCSIFRCLYFWLYSAIQTSEHILKRFHSLITILLFTCHLLLSFQERPTDLGVFLECENTWLKNEFMAHTIKNRYLNIVIAHWHWDFTGTDSSKL